MTVATPAAGNLARARSPWRSVAVPTEHGGWGLTAEPAVLGLVLEPGVAGALIAAAALLAFVIRTPLRVALVDHHRDRVLDRTRRAWTLVAAEGAVLIALVAGAVVTAERPFWVPALVAAPLIAVGLWFDMRSRSRRLVPELAGAYGVASVVAMVVLAGGGPASLAVAAWLVLAARSTTSIPHVRGLIAQLHHRTQPGWVEVVADLVAIAVLAAAVTIDRAVLAGAVAVVAVLVVQRVVDRRPRRAALVGAEQSALGLLVVIATAVGVHLA